MKAILVALVALAAFYGFYCGVMSVWSYFALADIVDRAIEERGKSAAAPVREFIIKNAAESGVRIEERNVVVTSDDRRLNVNLRWSYPVVSYKGEDVIEIPLSLERAFAR